MSIASAPFRSGICAIALTLAGIAGAASSSPTAEMIARGRYLSDAGDCMACHTVAKSGKPFAGGDAIDTPFGQMYAPNITPDRQTGIGSWTDEQFYRAMHDGLGQKGEYLYPVMPFPWYTVVTRDDVMAIKAYLFTQAPVHQEARPNKLSFPYNVRTALLAWRTVFFKANEFRPDPNQTDEVNRGAYLVTGLGHCGECHNSRPVAGTSRWRQSLQGGVVGNWYAPNITSDVHAGVGGWSDDQLVTFLKTGAAPGKGIAVGPMAEAVHSLSHLSETDLHAIAAYLKTTPAKAEEPRDAALYKGQGARGSQTYLNYCASCHGVDGKGYAGVIPGLAGNGSVLAKGPQNVMSVVVGGLPASGDYAPMPAIGAAMTDDEVADVVNYVRQTWNNAVPPTAMPGMVAKVRAENDTLMSGARLAGCPQVGSPDVARAVADKRNAIYQRLARMTDATQWQDATQLVATLEAAAPTAARADVVNGLVTAYCPIVRKDDTLDWGAKALRLGQFGQLAYSAARGHGGAAPPALKR